MSSPETPRPLHLSDAAIFLWKSENMFLYKNILCFFLFWIQGSILYLDCKVFQRKFSKLFLWNGLYGFIKIVVNFKQPSSLKINNETCHTNVKCLSVDEIFRIRKDIQNHVKNVTSHRGLWLAESDHMTWNLAYDYSINHVRFVTTEPS